MRKRRFGLFGRQELAAASFILMEAVTDEIIRELLRNPDKDRDAMYAYIGDRHVDYNSISSVFENLEHSAPKLLSVIRNCKNCTSPDEAAMIAHKEEVILPFVENCLAMMARQQDVEPRRSLQDGYYY